MRRAPRSCHKIRYRDRISALLALAAARHVDRPGRDRIEVRAYRCDRCFRWHLTSKPLRGRGVA